MKRLDIIIPVYNEPDNIERVLEGIRKWVKTPYTINLIYHSKKDATIPVVEKIKKRYPSLKTFVNQSKKGLGGQLRTGFKVTSAPLITVMMSDLSDNPKDIDKMVKKIDQGADLVCGSRYIPKGKRSGGSKIKALLSFTAGQSLNLLTGITTHDSTNAFKCFRRSVIESISLESRIGYELPLEITVKAYEKKFVIAEVPTIWKERDTGGSKFKIFREIPHYLRWYFYAIRHRYSFRSGKNMYLRVAPFVFLFLLSVWLMISVAGVIHNINRLHNDKNTYLHKSREEISTYYFEKNPDIVQYIQTNFGNFDSIYLINSTDSEYHYLRYSLHPARVYRKSDDSSTPNLKDDEYDFYIIFNSEDAKRKVESDLHYELVHAINTKKGTTYILKK